MPGRQAKVITPPMLKRMLRRVAHSSFPARDRAMILLSSKPAGAPARSPALIGRWFSTRRVACPARSTSATSSRRSAAGGGFLCTPTCGARWSGWPAPPSRSGRDPLLSRLAFEGEQHRELVRGALQGARLRRLFIAFRTAQLHHGRCSQHPPLWLQLARRATGHRSIETTERYIDGDTCAQRRLVGYI
jgi:hypothetical protein